MIIRIDNINIPELDIYARLSEVQLLRYYEPEAGIFIAESPIVIERALDSGYEPISILIETKHIETQGKMIIDRCPDVPVYTADYDVLVKITGYALTRGMLCAMKRKSLPKMEEILENTRRIAVLEDVVNPSNMGAIFRSAAALNMDAVLVTEASTDPLYRRSIRVSMGTVFQIPWTIVGPDWIQKLHSLGYKTAALALRKDTVSIDDPLLRQEEKLAVILGTEGEGLKEETIDACDYTIKIPMSHGVDSLNVAACSAVAFWELGK